MHPDLAVAQCKARGKDADTRSKPNTGRDPWPKIDDAAFYGLARDVVRAIDPHTEADRVAVLTQILSYYGNIIGRNPHYRIEGDYHRANIFIVLAGDTSKARKGTSAGRARSMRAVITSSTCVSMTRADASWNVGRRPMLVTDG